MQKTLILFISLLSSYSINAQDDNNDFFFSVEKDSLGICYGKSLQQAVWDTTYEEIIIREETRDLKEMDSIQKEIIPTDYYILNHEENLFAIIDFVDTTKSMIEVIGESRRLMMPSYYKDYYEEVTSTQLQREGYHDWIKDGEDFHESNKWIPSFTPPIYTKEVQFVVKVPGTTREEVVPAQFKTITAVLPKKNASPEQLIILNKLCKKYYTRKHFIKYYEEVVIPRESEMKEKYILKENAKTIITPIMCNYTKDDIIKIQRKLMSQNLYFGGIDGILNEYTKKAIIEYQLNNNLPIGQLDLQSLEHLL